MRVFDISLADGIKIFSFPIFILVVHGIISTFEGYDRVGWIDIPMHFFGGVSIGISYLLLTRHLRQSGHVGQMHAVAEFLFVVSVVAATAVAWEWHEFLLDYFFNSTTQPGLADTMADLFLGITGGGGGILVTRRVVGK